MNHNDRVLFKVEGLRLKRDGVPVLSDVDLTLRRGEVLGLVGANGAGKSSFMALLAGTLQPDGGRMTLQDQAYAPTTRAEGLAAGVGFVQQKLDCDLDVLVAEAIYRNTPHAGLPRAELVERASRQLADCGLERMRADVPMRELNHAERGLVEVARMFAEDVSVVILDEVAATFNMSEIVTLHTLVRMLVVAGRSVIYISHRLHEVVAVCDRVAVLRDGEVTVELDPRRVVLRDLADEMLEYAPDEPANRDGHVSDQVALSIEGLTAEGLQGVSFDLHRGEVLGVVGPRGSGVLDLGPAIAGLVPSTMERATLYGRVHEIKDAAGAAGLRIMHLGAHNDEVGVDAEESVATSLSTGEPTGQTFDEEVAQKRETVRQFQQLRLRTTGISKKTGALSGGDFAKVALQRWANSDTDIVVITQPTRGLDAAARVEVFNLLAAHTSAGRSAVLVTTEVDEILEWCDRVMLLRDGRIADLVPASQLDEEAVVRAMSVDDTAGADELRVVRTGRATSADQPGS